MNQNPYSQTPLYRVSTPSGSDLHLQTQDEADWYENNKMRYLSDNKFTNVSDLQELDRLLVMEVMVYRWSQWLSQGFDYQAGMIEATRIKNNIHEFSKEIRLTKQALGIDRSTREKDKGESLADYVRNLLARAKEFGYHRNDQYEMAVTKMYQLRSMVMTHDRSDEEERKELDLSLESIVQWIRDDLIANWDDLEESYRKNQAIWVKEI